MQFLNSKAFKLIIIFFHINHIILIIKLSIDLQQRNSIFYVFLLIIVIINFISLIIKYFIILYTHFILIYFLNHNNFNTNLWTVCHLFFSLKNIKETCSNFIIPRKYFFSAFGMKIIKYNFETCNNIHSNLYY